jgi:S1-C subfamily serine protease
VLEVAGERVTGRAQLFRKIWSLGPPGSEVPMTLAREGSISRVKLRSADRADFLKKPRLH